MARWTSGWHVGGTVDVGVDRGGGEWVVTVWGVVVRVTSELYGRAVRGCGNGVGNGVWVLSERVTEATRRGLLL